MKFIGNQKIVNLFKKSLNNGNINHAYIFSGPEHVGKFTLAKMFAISVISGKGMSLDTGNEDKDAFLDLVLISPEVVEKKGVVRKKDIPIEVVRDAKNSLSLFPYRGKYKILIIDEAHKMNVAAQNALLKILEEPNETTMIILVTSEIDKILPTIKSRAQIINFSLVGDEKMKKFFPEDIADLSVGRPGLAEIISKDENEKNFRLESKKQLEKILSGSINEKLGLAEEISKDAVKVLEKMDIWSWELRKQAILPSSARPSSVPQTSPAPIKSGHPLLEKEIEKKKKVFDQIEKIQKSIETLKSTNANARLVLEALFVKL